MDSDNDVSFDEAWRDFLIIRPIPYKFRFILYLDSSQRVAEIDIESLPKRELEGQQYFCDDSTIPSITLAYPENIVLPQIGNKIGKPFLGKRLEKWEIDALRGESEAPERKMEAQMGHAIKSEVEKLVSEEHYWEALFSLHQILEHRLRRMLMYKSMDIDRSSSKILIDYLKEKTWEKIRGLNV